jgi:hypothetical protein
VRPTVCVCVRVSLLAHPGNPGRAQQPATREPVRRATPHLGGEAPRLPRAAHGPRPRRAVRGGASEALPRRPPCAGAPRLHVTAPTPACGSSAPGQTQPDWRAPQRFPLLRLRATPIQNFRLSSGPSAAHAQSPESTRPSTAPHRTLLQCTQLHIPGGPRHARRPRPPQPRAGRRAARGARRTGRAQPPGRAAPAARCARAVPPPGAKPAARTKPGRQDNQRRTAQRRAPGPHPGRPLTPRARHRAAGRRAATGPTVCHA